MTTKNSPVMLSSVPLGQTAVIQDLQMQGVIRRRLLDFGFIKGATVAPVNRSPLGDPTAFRIKETTIALRKEEADMILVSIVGKEDVS